MVLSLCVGASAAEKTGSIRLVCHGKKGDKPVCLTGDTYALVRVADAHADRTAGTVRYTTCGGFAAYDCDWASLTASQRKTRAAEIAPAAVRRGQFDASGVTDAQGQVLFEDLSPGLYLLLRVKVKDANADYLFSPCFLSVPETVNGELVDHVVSTPKYQWDPPEEDPQIPQTGQLQWPIPVLMISGILLCLSGIGMLPDRKKKETGLSE